MDTAGHAVVFSGATVGIGLLSLVFLPVPFVRGIGLGGLLIPFVSVLVAITLLPVILATIGPRIDWPRLRKEDHMSAGWAAWTRGIVRWRWAAAAGAGALLVALVIAATTLSLGSPRANSLAKTGDAHDGLVALEDAGIGPGPLSPIEVLVPAAKADALRGQLAQVSGVRGAVAPDDAAWRRGDTAVIDVLPKDEQLAGHGRQTLDDVRAIVRPAGGDAGGQAAVSADFIDALYGNFPMAVAAIVVVTFALLAVAFRSVLLPLKSVLLNLLSVAATYGIVVLIWQHGFGSHAIWGIDSTGAITEWIPLMIFAFLFGLSMDYEVFILARIREEYDATGSTHQAVVAGIGRTGRLVTSAAMILFLAFIVLSTAPDTSLKIVATGLAAGILLDATVVRSVLVPALVALFGEWNWWAPSWGRRASAPAVRDAREAG